MDMSKLGGGDSQNTMPIAIQSGLAARQIAAAQAVEGAKFSTDAFMAGLKNPNAIKELAIKNLPLADALQQQSFFVRFAQKIPFVGERITKFLGPDAILNNHIGELGKDALNGVSKAKVTQIALEGEGVAKKLIAAGVPEASAKEIAEKAAQRAAAMTGQTVEAAAGAGGNVVKAAVKKGAQAATTTAAVEVSEQAAQNVLKGLSQKTIDAALPALTSGATGKALAKQLAEAGLPAKSVQAVMKRVATSTVETTVKTAGTEVTQKVTQSVTTEGVAETAKKGAGGLFKKLLGGIKGNFVIAGVFSLASNAIQLAQGKMSLKEFAVLTVADTAAYGAIGAGASAAGAAIGTALFPGVGTIAGFAIGLGIGLIGGWGYEKFIRNPLKGLLGGGKGGGEAAYTPQNNGVAPDPYAQAGGQAQQMAPAPGGTLSYADAMAQIDKM